MSFSQVACNRRAPSTTRAGRGSPRTGAHRVLVALALLFSLCACEPDEPPQTVAERFWRAAVAADRAALAREVREADQDSLQGDALLLPVERFALGKVALDGKRARIETEVTLGGDTPMTLAILTTLVQEAGHWRVDYASTVSKLRGDGGLAHLLGQLRRFSRDLGAGVDRSLGEVERALPELERELQRLEQDIRGKLPELRKRLDDLTRELPRAPRPEPAAPEAPPDTVKAI